MFLRDYLRIFLPLVGLVLSYRVIAVPWMEPTHARAIPIGPVASTQTQKQRWAKYFDEDAWQRKQPKILETRQGMVLLFENWEKLAPDRWKLHPLTILIEETSDKQPTATDGVDPQASRLVMIDSPDGAEICFREAIDFTSGKLPPVVSGQLDGKIEIFSPPSQDGLGDDGFSIQTRDLRIDRRHIWTTQAIQMKLGNSRIEGRDLSIYMDHDLLASPKPDQATDESPWNGLDHLELIYVDRVHVDLPGGGLFSKQATPQISMNAAPAHVELKCRGAFHFDFHRSLATLSSKVELRHIVEASMPDTFQSDRLLLHFEWSTGLASTDASQPTKQWMLDRIEAFGSQSMEPDDPTRWVRIDAPSIQTLGRSRWLRVDLKHGRIAMANHLPHLPATETSQVYLQRDTLQVWSPEVEYESQLLRSGPPSIPASHSSRLGQLWAAGPGQASMVSEDGDAWRLSWAKSLQLQPDGPVDRLTIDGSANARSERQGRFSAETVDIWLRSISEEVLTFLASQRNGDRPSSIITERLHANGKVIIHSDLLRTQVSDLKLWFQYPEIDSAIARLQAVDMQAATEPTKLVTSPDGTNQRLGQPGLPTPSAANKPSSPIGTAFSHIISLANNSSSAPVLSATTAPSFHGPGQLTGVETELSFSKPDPSRLTPTPFPTNVTGDTLVAKLSQSSQGLVIEDLALSGNATITRNQLSPSSPLPLTIVGEQIRLDSSDQGYLDATIQGTPAKFSIGAGAMESSEIHLNQQQQLIWMDQPGIFRMPTQAFPAQTSSVIAPNRPLPVPAEPTKGGDFPGLMPSPTQADLLKATAGHWVEPPRIEWQGRMVFDGRTARMDGGVSIDGRLQSDPETIWHFDGRARELNVTLDPPMSFTDRNVSPSTISAVQLIDQVDLKAAETDARGVRRSLNRLEVPELTFLVPQQQWIGLGPGSFRTSRIGPANPGNAINLTGNSTTAAPLATPATAAAELQCLHLRFRGKMEGDMSKQLVIFYDRVETLLQPILSWEELPDVQLVDRLHIGQTTLMCDQLGIYNNSQLSWNQSQLAQPQTNLGSAWEVTGAGRVVVESVNQQGAFAVTANRVQYAALYHLLRMEGLPGQPALIRRLSAQDPPGTEPTQAAISSGSINIQTGEADLSIVNIRADLRGLTGQLPAPNPAAAPQPLAPVAPPAPIPSPRDSYPLRRP